MTMTTDPKSTLVNVGGLVPNTPFGTDAQALLEREGINLHYVTSPDQVAAVLPLLLAAKGALGLDIETARPAAFAHDPLAGLDPYRSRVRLVQCYAGGPDVYVFDIDALGWLPLSALWQKRFIAHNALFELKHLRHVGIPVEHIGCTMLQANALGRGLPKIQELAQHHLQWSLDKTLQSSDWNQQPLTRVQLAYAALDAVAVYRISAVQLPLLHFQDRWRTYVLMRDAQLAIAQLELNGVHLDFAAHEELCSLWEACLQERKSELIQHMGPGINPNSARQIAQWLENALDPDVKTRWQRTPSGQLKTDADTLEKLRGASLFIPLLAFKDAAKRLSSFGKGYAHQRNPVTGRLHPSFTLGGTVTGRLSCSKPNIQQAPKDPAFRQLFTAPPGRILVVADFNQMELRVAALLSNDNAMLAAYERGDDLHVNTASAMAGVHIDQVTKMQRNQAKAVNFGMLFGMGAAGLVRYAANQYGVAMTESEAAQARAAFFDNYPRIREWQQQTAKRAEQIMMVTTPAGRVRDFREEEGGYKYTEALNTPVQGGAAEVLLAALGRLPALLAGLDAKPVNIVHDEIVIEVGLDDAEEAKRRLEQAMQEGMCAIFPQASLHGLVEAHIGENWGQAK